ncbi:uncharacterized protein LOC128962577 [Oppia nitens]|uniref:uncharacterized protein LOC128962577 n=1 Tax=Oppia nitens TaxID=1686743 RepID=UPI0023DA98AA|nr:uncharacterized protein LOC128962577 [Oppia nitens]
MISEMKFQLITIVITFTLLLCMASITSANNLFKLRYNQINENPLNRIRRSIDEYYDSLTPDMYEPLLKEHSILRSAAKRAAAMGVDLPDYLLHYKGNGWSNLGSFREKMQKSGK